MQIYLGSFTKKIVTTFCLLLLALTLVLPASAWAKKKGGGMDGSGGDPILSTEVEVRAALENIDIKAFNALFRLFLLMSEHNRATFERDFGDGTYDLLGRMILGRGSALSALHAIKSKTITFDPEYEGPCVVDEKDHHAGAAYGKEGHGSICLSIPELRKVSPLALQTETIVLALHEISHLYGFDKGQSEDQDEEEAKLIQNLARNLPGFTNPRPSDFEVAARLLNRIEMAGAKISLNLAQQKSSDEICVNLRNLVSDYENLLRSHLPPISNHLPVSMGKASDFFLGLNFAASTLGFCDRSPTNPSPGLLQPPWIPFGDREALTARLGRFMYPAFAIQMTLSAAKDPFVSPMPAAGFFPNVTLVLESFVLPPAKEKTQQLGNGSDPYAFDPSINMACWATPLDIQNGVLKKGPTSSPVFPRKVAESEHGRLYGVGLDAQNGVSIMVQQRHGITRGATVAVMAKDIQSARAAQGLVTFDTNQKTLIPVNLLTMSPGSQLRATIRLANDGITGHARALEVRCETMKSPSSSSKPSEAGEPLLPFDLLIRVQRDSVALMQEDKSFARSVQGTLKFYNGLSDQHDDEIGSVPLTKVFLSDNLIFQDADAKNRCVISDEQAERWGLDLRAIAEAVARSKNTIVTCWNRGPGPRPIDKPDLGIEIQGTDLGPIGPFIERR